MKCPSCGAPVTGSQVACDCGFHLVEKRMLPATPEQATVRAAFLARQASSHRNAIAGAVVLVVSLAASLSLYIIFHDSAVVGALHLVMMISPFAVLVGWRAFRLWKSLGG